MAEHNELGKKGEALAKAFLEAKKYKILASNWRYQKLEVDIIAQKHKFLVFVEVKTRNTDVFGLPESFVSRKQQQNLANAVEAYFYLYPNMGYEIRYDVVSIILKGEQAEIEHFEDAFWPDNLGLYSFE
jgi:putative endonuclease